MERVHVINEDYDHYQERRKRENWRTIRWVLPVLAICFILLYFASKQNIENLNNPKPQTHKPGTIYCGMPVDEFISLVGQPNETTGNTLHYYEDNVDTMVDFSSTETGVPSLGDIHSYPMTDPRSLMDEKKILGCWYNQEKGFWVQMLPTKTLLSLK